MGFQRQIALMMQAASATAEPVFWANTYDPDTFEMLGVRVGIGGLTEARAYQLQVPDYEGVYRTFEGGEPAWQGGRVVRNCYEDSEAFDLGTTSWTMVGTRGEIVGVVPGVGPNGEDATEVLFYAGQSAASLYRYVASGIPYLEGDTHTQTWLIRAISPGKRVKVRLNAVSETLPLTGEWQLLARTLTASGVISTIGLYVDSATTETRFQIIRGQCEAGDSSSEYVKTEGSAVIKAFANYNGNTVTDNVVTEAVGAPLPEVPRLVHAPTATNSVTQSNDLTTTWTLNGGLRSLDQVGMRGEANGATLITDTSSGASDYVQYVGDVGQSIDTCSAVFRLRRESTANSVPGFKLAFGSGGSDYVLFGVNPVTGDSNLLASANLAWEISVVPDGDWWLIGITATSSESTFVLQVYGAIGADISAIDVSATGSCAIGNVEFYDSYNHIAVMYALPVFTDGVAVTRDNCELTFDPANQNDLRCTWLIEYECEFSYHPLTVLARHSSSTPTDVLFVTGTSDNTVRSGPQNSPTSSVGRGDGFRRVAMVYDRDSEQLGVWTELGYTERAAVGWTRALTTLALGYPAGLDSLRKGRFGAIKRYDVSYDEGKALAEAWVGGA